MQDEHSAELAALRERLNNAKGTMDAGLMIGCAKDLLEATCKIVMSERAVTFGDQTKAPEIVSKTLPALDLPSPLKDPGDDEIDRIVAGLWEAGKATFDLRNRVGTGHGRPTTPSISYDLAVLAVGAVETWVDWALIRLERIQLGDVDGLLAELLGGTFYSGTLRHRLGEVRLHALDEADQQRLGVAVAQRCRRQTFTVINDGLDDVVADVNRWPKAYRAGLVEGLLINANGQLHPQFVDRLVVLIPSLERDDWSLIVDQARDAPWAPELTIGSTELASEIAARMAAHQGALPTFFATSWQEIVDSLRGNSIF